MSSTRNFILGLMALSVIFAGCTIPGQVFYRNTDAIAVWQHEGDTWDIWYSVWDHDSKIWYVPNGGISAPIAIDEGNDHDPDVSSNDETAVAVWSKDGDTIYYSIWKAHQWTVPSKLSSGSSDTDPTVAVDPSGNALAVWVSGGNNLYYSYYKDGVSWTSPSMIETEGIEKVSLPELTYNAYDGVYYLVFTGSNGTDVNAYMAAYGTTLGWSLPSLVGDEATLDNKLPTDQRTGVSAAETKKEITAVWPATGNDIYSVMLGGTANNFADGMMPDVSYDYSDIANGAYTDDYDLFHQPNVNSPTSENTISSLDKSDDRASLTFIKDRTVGLVVWWNEVVSPGQIYYSYYENGMWFTATQLDGSLGGSLDRNPAVTPLTYVLIEPPTEEPPPYCGDGILNLLWEQCEVGIPCPRPNEVCNLANCQCEVPPPPQTNLSCFDNSWALSVGISFFGPGMVCTDDCFRFGNDYECDMAVCDCVKKKKPEVSCTLNSFDAAVAANTFNASAMVCEDDCEDLLGDDYECDLKTCVCEEKEEKELSCTENTWNVALDGQTAFAAGMQCKDDCEEQFGEGVYCEMKSCVCEEEPEDEVVYCAGHTEEVISTDVNNFNASTMVCEDNCEELGEDYVCNLGSCTCTKPPKEDVSCFGNALDLAFDFMAGGTGDSSYSPNTMVCIDDCAEYSEELICNLESCVCEPKEPVMCAANTESVIETDINNFDSSKMVCYDNCVEQLGEGYKCYPSSCTCVKEKEQMSCAGNLMDLAFTFNLETGFDPATMVCLDDCDSLKAIFDTNMDLECDLESCICLPPPTPQLCTGNTLEVLRYDYNYYDPSYLKCEDNCEEFGEGYYCDMEPCVCRRKPGTEVYCAANTGEAYITASAGASFVPFNPQTMQCRDNCEAALGEGYVCDLDSCFCVPGDDTTVSCSAHTDHVTVTDVNNFNPQTMTCSDDCAEYYGSDYECNLGSCTCTRKDTEGVSCSANTQVPNVADISYAAGQQCNDDCAEILGEEYVCDLEGCYCKSTSVITPRCGDGYVSTPNVPGGGNEECDVGQGNPDTCYPPLQCNPETCQCEEPAGEAICGDGVITSPEECDYGSYNTNKCDEETYCTEGCMCADLETSVVCGDGKISYPYEECDGGNVLFNTCPEGQECFICQCIGEVAECGDGTITPPEECDHGNSYTAECPAGLYCSSCACISYDEITHKECDYELEKCVDVQGPGEDTCYSDYQCEEPSYCGNNEREGSEECDGTDDSNCDYDEYCSSNCVCVEETQCGNNEREGSEECDGTDDSNCDDNEYCSPDCVCVEEAGECGDGEIDQGEECEYDEDCYEGEFCYGCLCWEIPSYCGDGYVDPDEECDPEAIPDGCDEPGVCGGNCECVYPPSLDCDSVCEATPGASSFGGGYGSSQACMNGVADYYGEGPDCYTQCTYSWYYEVSNIAGTSSCCCGMNKLLECTNCPCISPCDPQCPGEDACEAAAPDWYVP